MSVDVGVLVWDVGVGVSLVVDASNITVMLQMRVGLGIKAHKVSNTTIKKT